MFLVRCSRLLSLPGTVDPGEAGAGLSSGPRLGPWRGLERGPRLAQPVQCTVQCTVHRSQEDRDEVISDTFWSLRRQGDNAWNNWEVLSPGTQHPCEDCSIPSWGRGTDAFVGDQAPGSDLIMTRILIVLTPVPRWAGQIPGVTAHYTNYNPMASDQWSSLSLGHRMSECQASVSLSGAILSVIPFMSISDNSNNRAKWTSQSQSKDWGSMLQQFSDGLLIFTRLEKVPSFSIIFWPC